MKATFNKILCANSIFRKKEKFASASLYEFDGCVFYQFDGSELFAQLNLFNDSNGWRLRAFTDNGLAKKFFYDINSGVFKYSDVKPDNCSEITSLINNIISPDSQVI